MSTTFDPQLKIPAASRDPRFRQAAAALARRDLDTADPALRGWLAEHPDDPQALRMLADLVGRRGDYAQAEALLMRALAVAPGFDAARFDLALVLHRQSKGQGALAEIDRLLAAAPQNPAYRNLKGAMLARIGDYAGAIALYEAVVADTPQNPRGWMSYGHALKTIGRGADCVTAYRTAVAQAPTLGEAWWSLANLKTFRFTDPDIAAIDAALARQGLSDDDRLHLEFASGKALEDRGQYEASFRRYAAGNARRRAQLGWDSAGNHAHSQACQALFTAEFLAARAGAGCPARDPIFIVGLPRSGSTLIEQILSSHSQVEGTSELPDIAAIARGLGDAADNRGATYLDDLARCDAAALAAMGADYIARTRIHRRTDRPYFVDKMPNNFAYVGLIHLILPNAIVIDARRHAMATCFSAWKQHFARGQAYSYDLAELGAFYTDYVALMGHFDRVLPGRVLRVSHEALVTDTETEVRRLLDHIGLAFEPGCLAFHENKRPVRTASAQQVRQPIFTNGLDHWRNFAPWLGDLKAALGPDLSA